jgi:hypothetical protein
MRRKFAHSMTVLQFFAVVCLGLQVLGCTGELLTSHSKPDDPSQFDPSLCQPPPSRIVRLSKLEMQNSVTDLLATTQAISLPDDAKFLNFSSNALALFTSPFGDALWTAAETLATDFRAKLNPAQFGNNCDTSDDNARICATKFITTYAQKAFRRPLAQADIDGLLAVYDAGRETGIDNDVLDRFKSGVDYTLRAILQSPDFVYRIELGDPSTAVKGIVSLTPYEAASSLSYMLLASPPDDELLAAAANNQLATPEAIEMQARRLLTAMPERFASQMRRFVREWLAIDLYAQSWNKNTDVYPLYSTDLKSAIDEETNLYINDWVAQGATLTSLLTRSETFVNATNAPLYGLTSSSDTMQKVSLDPTQRSGILTMPAFLGTRAHVDSSAPILRGVSIVRGVMCLTIPPPPPNVPPLPPITDTDFTTTRDQVEKHVASPTCMACHGRINPLGYPFENYDGLGVFRTKENGYDIDSSGAIVGTQSSDKTVANAIELTHALASSSEVQVCFDRQLFRSTFGRDSTVADECSLRDSTQAYQAKQLDTRELLISLLKSQTFAKRSSN